MTSNFQQLQAHFDDLHRTQERSRAAALNGALKAFEKPRLDASKPAAVSIQHHGAYSAATSAAGRVTPKVVDRAPHSADGNTAAAQAFTRHQQSHEHLLSRSESPYKLHQESRRSSAQSLALAHSDDLSRAKSPSNIAAVLAAQRFTPRETTLGPFTNTPKSWHIDAQLLQEPSRTSPHRLDESEQQPLPGAVSGVADWLESIRRESPPRRLQTRGPSPGITMKKTRTKTHEAAIPGVQETHEEVVRVSSPPEIRSPKPVRVPSVSKKLRESSFESSVFSEDLGEPTKLSDALQSSKVGRINSAHEPEVASPHDKFTTPPLFPQNDPDTASRLSRANTQKPEPPPPRRSSTLKVSKSSPAIGLGLVGTTSRIAERTPPPPPTRMSSRDMGSNLQIDHQIAALTASSHHLPTRRISPHMTGDSLANAIVASSLASSRAPSPTKPNHDRPGMARRSTDRPRTPFSHFKQQLTGDARTSIPGVYTMRKRTSFDDESVAPQHSKVSRNIFGMRQHPNKHREGDRKRWRSELTEIERKRYEGVWAANRGLFADKWFDVDQVSTEALKDECANIVVRELWNRSRLPAYVLEEVWDLVDRRGIGRLDREEFCIGLWLIDQRLMGKKLPVKVGDSVWRSVHGVQGLRIPSYKKQ